MQKRSIAADASERKLHFAENTNVHQGSTEIMRPDGHEPARGKESNRDVTDVHMYSQDASAGRRNMATCDKLSAIAEAPNTCVTKRNGVTKGPIATSLLRSVERRSCSATTAEQTTVAGRVNPGFKYVRTVCKTENKSDRFSVLQTCVTVCSLLKRDLSFVHDSVYLVSSLLYALLSLRL